MSKLRIVFLALLIIIAALCIMGLEQCSRPANLLNFEKTVQKIEFDEENDRWIFTFVGDKALYTFSEENEVTFDCVSQLKSGDKVTITVRDDYAKVKFVILYEIRYNDELLFSFVEAYNKENYQVSVTFIIATVACAISTGYFIVCKRKEEPQTESQFCIYGPWFAFCLGVVLAITAFSIILTIAILWLFYGMASEDFYAISACFLLFLVLGLLLVYVYTREKFILNNGVYKYVKPFKKSQSVNVEDIYCIRVTSKSANAVYAGFITVEFIDQNGNSVVKFLDDGTAFKKGLFARSLIYYKKPIAVNVLCLTPEQTRYALMPYGNKDNVELLIQIKKEVYKVSLTKEYCLVVYPNGTSVKLNDFNALLKEKIFNGLSLAEQWKNIKYFDYLDYEGQ